MTRTRYNKIMYTWKKLKTKKKKRKMIKDNKRKEIYYT